MIRNLIGTVGGRGFIFAVFAFLFTSGYALFNGMEWGQWLDYNKWIGAAFMSAKAVEGAAYEIRKRGS